MSEREHTVLAIVEEGYYGIIETSDNPYEVRDAITELGFTHLAMEPAKFKQAVKEIWAGMHSRSNIENLGIIARVGGYISAGFNDPLTLEYAAALRADRETAK